MDRNTNMLLVGCIGCSTLAASAQINSAPTNSMPNSMPEWSAVSLKTIEPPSLWIQLERNTIKSGQDAALDHFGDVTHYSWMKLTISHGYNTLPFLNEAGEEVFKKTFVNGVRETLGGLPVAQSWDTKWLGEIWSGSIGNTAEEEFHPGSIVPSESQKTLWQRVKTDGCFIGGVRLDDPSINGSARFGHVLNNPFLIVHARFGYQPMDRSIASFDFISPLPFGELSGGLSCNAIEFDSRSMVTYVRVSHGLLSNGKDSSHLISSLFWFVGISHSHATRALDYQAGINWRI